MPSKQQDIENFLLKTPPLVTEGYKPSEELKQVLFSHAKVLVIGADRLGCELLKNLAMIGFKNIDVIDADTIELTNLNRQFLFRKKDIGRYKSKVATESIKERLSHLNLNITPHVGQVQDMDNDFQNQFNIFIAGLNNINARQWINTKAHELVKFNPVTEEVDESTVRILIDGGTEGLYGQCRVIIPFKTSCYECTMKFKTPQRQFQLCTIAEVPRLPEHCIAYVYEVLWKENKDQKFDSDSMDDMTWIQEEALKRAENFKIEGVTYSMTMGITKNIIPAIANSNAAIASLQATEAFKLVTRCSKHINTNTLMASRELINVQLVNFDREDDCYVCSKPLMIIAQNSDTLKQVLSSISNKYDIPYKNITFLIGSGETLFGKKST